ncbi:putative hemolysin [Bradyrhizobium japonicum]
MAADGVTTLPFATPLLSEIATGSWLVGVNNTHYPYCDKYGGRTQCADTRDCHQPACDVLSIGDRLDLLCHFANPFFEAAEIGEEIAHQATHHW